MEEQIREEGAGIAIKNILFALKRYLALVIAVIVLCTALGIGYSFIKKPNYTATEEVTYLASDEKGKYDNTATSINIMRSYFNTVVDFCDEGVVVERANYYYIQFKNVSSKDPTYTVDDFIYEVENGNYNYDENMSTETDIYDPYIVKGGVSFSAKVESTDQDKYAFSISYTDPNRVEAQNKARIYVEAFKQELKTTAGINGGKYFDGIKIEIISLGSSGVSSDVSKTKITVIGFMVGVVIAAVIVYVLSALDSSIKSKEELEEISGTNLLAYIQYQGGKK